ncbi:MAG: hypothetical protein ACTHQ3_10925 [Motilibacteraceae bacterium]
MTTAVSDEVWAQLPQQRLPLRQVLGVVGAVLLVLVAAVVVDRLGLVRPQLSVIGTAADASPGTGRLTEHVTVHNAGVADVTLERVGTGVAWLAVDRVVREPQLGASSDVTTPFVLPAGQDTVLGLDLRVVDCRALSRRDVGLQLLVRAPLGTSWASPHVQGTTDPAAPDSYTYSGPQDPWEVPWPVTEAAAACDVPLPPR